MDRCSWSTSWSRVPKFVCVEVSEPHGPSCDVDALHDVHLCSKDVNDRALVADAGLALDGLGAVDSPPRHPEGPHDDGIEQLESHLVRLTVN